ncbi:Protein PyrBI [Diplonema papillatum]|nr:Protein PyrBI [Diplonema papillatum]
MDFKGRSLSVVNDFTPEEQWYLYDQTRLLKEAVKGGGDVAPYRIQNANQSVYLIFMEDSTRTKESFRNAALFHGCKMNVFDAATSSFNKKESITDTVKMLCGYSTDQSIFVIRSKLEGTCTWLAKTIGEYCVKQLGLPKASFINAGDGRHEHPTQEFLDEFSFLEQKAWDRSSIHLVLIGDLYHGRTVHSKTDGLRVFEKVAVDLIAPPELELPAEYEERMVANGFTVRKFSTIDDYLAQDSVASIWYFTRLQLERMGDKILGREEYLRRAVTFRRDLVSKVPADSKFYHPLPRHQKYPVLPTFLDTTSFNAYDGQSVNGYFTRIIELALVGGAIGSSNASPRNVKPPVDFVEEVPLGGEGSPMRKDAMTMGIKPVSNGLVIDHIGRGSDIAKCWETMTKLMKILCLKNEVGSTGVFQSKGDKNIHKGIVFLPELEQDFFTKAHLKKLSAISPGCTLNVIKNDCVKAKFRLHMPPLIYDFEEIDCTNAQCISHSKNHEHAMVYFNRTSKSPPVFCCAYCEKPHKYDEIWATR